MRRLLMAPLLLLGIAANSFAAEPGIVQTAEGRLRGQIADGAVAFKGIPYAQPPVGRLRWRPPQPVAAWQGVREATSFGHDCMQIPDPMEAAPKGSTTPGEDCLYLNLWAPAAPHNKAAVIVWIHGGGFVNGGSSSPIYDGSAFARHGVIFISFNFRLGRFGFFAHPALAAENPADLHGNYAYMDQIAVLQWIQRNAAAFGADPKNVTVIGESAGGGSVHFLATSPMTKGLFEKAIVESGGGRDGTHPRHLNRSVDGVASGETLGTSFAEKHGIKGFDGKALEALRSLPPSEVVDGLDITNRRADAAVGATFPGPMIDGKLIAETSEAAYRAGAGAKISYILGGNDSDLAYPKGNTVDELLKPFGADAAKARALYDPNGTGNIHDIGNKVARDRGQLEPARFLSRLLSDQGRTVYEFRFSYVASSMRSEWSDGAPHASEVPFVFETLVTRYGAAATADDRAAADAISGYWIQFAKTGNPNHLGLPVWPAYRSQQDILANFTTHGVVMEKDPWKARMDVTEASHRSDQ